MGVKRSFEEEDFSEPFLKQPKQLNYNKLTSNTEESQITTLIIYSPGEAKSDFCKLQFEGPLEDSETDGASIADKELEASTPTSLVPSSSSEEDALNGDISDWSCFPGYIDFTVPRRPSNQFIDPNISLLNSSPAKEVPVGPDHQAEVPMWGPNASRKDFDHDSKLLGTCIIAMPYLSYSTMEGIRVGRGRADCICLDVGSMRCVKQHVNEAREKLRETIGDEKFSELGFCDMGDEVAHKWTQDDQRIFHEVVFSSRGGRFWKHLSVAFPTRTKELVSYYFNVFMLHRRAVQNRSYLLEIDSDDDEEQRVVHRDLYQNGSHSLDQDTDIDDDHQGPNGECYFVGGEEEDSTVDSLDDQDFDESWVDDFLSEKQDGVEMNSVKEKIS